MAPEERIDANPLEHATYFRQKAEAKKANAEIQKKLLILQKVIECSIRNQLTENNYTKNPDEVDVHLTEFSAGYRVDIVAITPHDAAYEKLHEDLHNTGIRGFSCETEGGPTHYFTRCSARNIEALLAGINVVMSEGNKMDPALYAIARSVPIPSRY